MTIDHPDYQANVVSSVPVLLEGQVPWYQSDAAAVGAEDTEDLINYVVPDGYELNVCAGMVSCGFPCTQRFDLRTTPAGSWVSPTSHIDDDSMWFYEERAYDGDTGTFARCIQNAHYLQLLLSSPVLCDKVRIYAAIFYIEDSSYADPDIDIDVYYEGAWHNIFSGTVTYNTWVEKTFTEKTVNKARVKWNSGIIVMSTARFYEFQFDMSSVTAQEGTYFDTNAIIPYQPMAPYHVAAGDTFSVRVYNDDDSAHNMSVALAGFLNRVS